MDSFVRRLVVVALMSVPPMASGGAQEPSALPELSRRVSEIVGGLWSVPPERIQLEWGAVLDPSSLTADVGLELRGTGRDGWFGVLIQRDDRPPFAVRIRAGINDTVAVAARALTGSLGSR